MKPSRGWQVSDVWTFGAVLRIVNGKVGKWLPELDLWITYGRFMSIMFLDFDWVFQSIMVYTSINAASTVCTRCFEKMEILASWWSIFFPPFIVAVGAFYKLRQSQRKSLQDLWRCKEFYYCIILYIQYLFGLHLHILELLYVHIAVP